MARLACLRHCPGDSGQDGLEAGSLCSAEGVFSKPPVAILFYRAHSPLTTDQNSHLITSMFGPTNEAPHQALCRSNLELRSVRY